MERDLQKLVGSDVAAEGNFIVETHLDPTLQEVVEVSLQRFLQANSASGINQGAVVVLDSRTGGILSLVGGATTAPANTTALQPSPTAARQRVQTLPLSGGD